MTTSDIADHVWRQHLQWSAAAGDLKRSLTRWRTALLVLAIIGAFVETLSTQVSADYAKPIAWVGAAILALIPLFTPRMLSAARTKAWIRARSISERLKSEGYLYAARAAPYDGAPAEAADLLRQRAKELASGAPELAKFLGTVQPTSAAPASLSPTEYVCDRVQDQIRWFRANQRLAAERAARFRRLELALTVGAVLAASAAGVYGQQLSLGGQTVTIGAWVAVLTTCATTLTAHSAASRYDYLETSYSSTALELEHQQSDWPPSGGATPPSRAWSEFVRRCEEIISKENEAWLAKWSSASGE